MDEQNKAVSDVYFPDPNDMILPDDFDPNNPNYDLGAGLTEDAPAADAPTTETQPTENDAAVPEQQVQEQAPTTAPVQPDAQTEGSVPPVDTTVPPVAQVPPVPQTIRVRFNHEDRDLTLDEAATLAQKGMNYDRMQQRLTDLEARSTKNEDLAKRLGYKSADEMFEAAEKNYVERQVEELVEQGNTEAIARFIVEQRMQKAAPAVPAPSVTETPEPVQTPTAPVQETKPAANSMSPEREAELREFVQAHPGVTKLPDEVIRMNKAGVRLLVAYERFQNQAALNELAILKQNQAAAAKAPVSGVTGRPGTQQKQEDDPFIKGFDSDPWNR